MIRLLVLDIDGVLTDGVVLITEDNREVKSLYYRDIDAIYRARSAGIQIALITGEDSPLVTNIAKRLHVDTVMAGAKDKSAALLELCELLNVPVKQTCYVGDSDRDAPAISIAGLGLAPSDASQKARQSSRFVLSSQGGRGAAAEVVEMLMQQDNSAK